MMGTVGVQSETVKGRPDRLGRARRGTLLPAVLALVGVALLIAGCGKKATRHIVVPADPARWSVPPFSGTRQNGFLYGRGAVDMKCEGILQLLALLRLKREPDAESYWIPRAPPGPAPDTMKDQF